MTDNGKLRVMNKFITVGVAGHVDHGKTSLVRCLTGIDTDRLKEEKRRGLSIEPSVAPLQLPSGSQIALVDVPGHSDFLKNTIRGLSSVDTAILVVAADDGVMPQTKDHLEVLKFLKAKGGFIVLSKADVVDVETLELAEMEIREIVEGSFLEAKPVIPFSAMDGRGIHDILLAMESEAERVAGKALQDPFRLWIDQVRSFPGFGTVVSGTVLSGSIRRDDIVGLLPSGKQAKVRFIEVHHQRVEQAVAGQRVGINLHGISLQEVNLGTVLAAPGVLSPAGLLNAELSLLPTARRPILSRQRVKLYLGTYCATALLVMMENERLHPGETALVQLRLQEPLAVLPRDPFVISPMNLHCVIGGGKILETPKEKFRAAKAEKTLAYLQPLQREDVKSILGLYFSKFPSRPVTAEEISSATGFPVEKYSERQSRQGCGLEKYSIWTAGDTSTEAATSLRKDKWWTSRKRFSQRMHSSQRQAATKSGSGWTRILMMRCLSGCSASCARRGSSRGPRRGIASRTSWSGFLRIGKNWWRRWSNLPRIRATRLSPQEHARSSTGRTSRTET